MDALKRWFGRCLVVGLAFAVVWQPLAARAQSDPQATTITLGAPPSATLGSLVTVQALLVDASGQAIPKATVDFVVSADFLHTTGDMVVASAVTNPEGQAVASFEARSSGNLTLKAVFRGDADYATSTSVGTVSVTGDQQLYVEDIGLHVPFFNAPPAVSLGDTTVTIAGALWPAVTGWPIAATLLVIWSLYLVVVTLVFRVANVGRDHVEDRS